MPFTKQISDSNRNDRSEMIFTTGNVFEEVSSERCLAQNNYFKMEVTDYKTEKLIIQRAVYSM